MASNLHLNLLHLNLLIPPSVLSSKFYHFGFQTCPSLITRLSSKLLTSFYTWLLSYNQLRDSLRVMISNYCTLLISLNAAARKPCKSKREISNYIFFSFWYGFHFFLHSQSLMYVYKLVQNVSKCVQFSS